MIDNLALLNKPGMASQYPELGTFFLDCGAYSVLTGVWSVLPIDDYIDFVIRYQSKIQLLVVPDVIGSASETFAYLKRFVQALKRRGEWESLAGRVVITYHLIDRDLPTFCKMAEWAYAHGVRWLAVGGIAGTEGTKEAKWVAIEAVKNTYTALQLPFKLHLFGGSSLEFIYYFRPDAVDSSTYLAKGSMLGLLRFDKKAHDLYGFTTHGCTNIEQVNFIMSILGNYDIEMDRIGFKKEIMNCPPAIRCQVCNLLTIRELEKEVCKKLGNPAFKYWVSLDSGSFILVSSKHGRHIAQLFYTGWKDRCLFSYASLWEQGGSVSFPWLRTFFKELGT